MMDDIKDHDTERQIGMDIIVGTLREDQPLRLLLNLPFIILITLSPLINPYA